MPTHARHYLDDDARAVAAVGECPQVGQPRDGVHDPLVGAVEHLTRSPGRKHQDVAGEVRRHSGDLVVCTDREGIYTERFGLDRENAVAESVSVALGDGHQTGLGGQDGTQVPAPRVGVD